MAYEKLQDFTWSASSPKITGTIYYDYQRSGADMQYKIKTVLDPLPYSSSSYGFNIYETIKLDGVVKVSAHQIKGNTSYDRDGYTYETGWLTVSGKSSGTTELSVNIYTTSDPDRINKTYTNSMYVVPAIAKVTYAENFNSNGAPTIKFSNPSGFNLRPYLNFYDASGTRIYQIIRDLGQYSSPYQFTLSSTEKTELLNAANKASSYTVTEGVSTYNGDTLLDSNSIEKTFTVVADSTTKPTDSIAVEPVGSLPNEFSGLYLQGKTQAKITHTATFNFGATAASYSASVADKTYSGQDVTTEYINVAGTLTVQGTVKDSRGFTASDSKTIEVIPYAKPAVAQIPGLQEIVCGRCDEDGNLSASGTYLKVRCSRRYSTVTSGGVQKNFCLLRLRVNSGSWKTLITRTAAGDTYDGVVPGVTLNVDSVYTIQIEAVDDIGEVHDIYFDIPTEEVPFHLGEGGLNIGVGRYANMESSERVDVAWDTYFERDVSIDGDSSVSGDMNVDGNADVGGLSIGGVEVDYIVEQRTDGEWTYRKWSSGVAECWGTLTYQSPISSVYGSIYYVYTTDCDFPTSLFISTPKILATSRIQGMAWVSTRTATKDTANYYIFYPVSHSGANWTFDVHAIGRWK